MLAAVARTALSQLGLDSGLGDRAVYNRATKKCVDLTPLPCCPIR